MRKIFLVGAVVVATVVGYAAYRSRPDDGVVVTAPSEQLVVPPSDVEAHHAPETETPPATVPPELAAQTHEEHDAVDHDDDGDDHGQEQGETFALEVPPPSGEAIGADPRSEANALNEARAILDSLARETDPSTRAEIATLLEAIEGAQ